MKHEERYNASGPLINSPKNKSNKGLNHHSSGRSFKERGSIPSHYARDMQESEDEACDDEPRDSGFEELSPALLKESPEEKLLRDSGKQEVVEEGYGEGSKGLG